ncbi:hypothetical protein BXY66_0331 [Shimia isoporae]|uniref:Uncharacterized protein n=1 Tax=Shimia isoporae TaxID=647720 RepID=A0A4R1NJ71_9RHOB|nr:hypothetical protein [Shimia isoporae]TCL08296.1 hypothetical protein BXY66_0331 [Shimia isoporae]
MSFANSSLVILPPEDVRPEFLALCGHVAPLKNGRGQAEVTRDAIRALGEFYSNEVLFIELMHQFAVRSARHVLPDGAGRILPVSLTRLRLSNLVGPIKLKSRVYRVDGLAVVVIGGVEGGVAWRPLAVVRVASVPVGEM